MNLYGNTFIAYGTYPSNLELDLDGEDKTASYLEILSQGDSQPLFEKMWL